MRSRSDSPREPRESTGIIADWIWLEPIVFSGPPCVRLDGMCSLVRDGFLELRGYHVHDRVDESTAYCRPRSLLVARNCQSPEMLLISAYNVIRMW